MDDYISLLKNVDGVDEVWEERRFLVYYKGVPLVVIIADQGPEGGSSRFQVSATNKQGDPEFATSHSYATLNEALDDVNWWVFK